MATPTLLCISSASLLLSSASNAHPKKRKPPPISISADPSHVEPLRLRDLLASAGHSCHRFPRIGPDGRAEPADPAKLRAALAHSSVVVSVFCRRPRILPHDRGNEVSAFGFEQLLERAVTAMDSERQLVGFGRAVSDGGLTASIHDVVVIPSLQRLGIGRKIVQRIIRVLTNKGIYDISALCSEKERLFFKACGFGVDSLGSTTMMYTRTAPCCLQDDLVVTAAGRLLLLVPPLREPYLSKRIAVQLDDPSEVEKEAEEELL